MREAIEEAGGNEVFFAGSLDGSGRVQSIRTVARGNQGAVPAFLEAVGTRDVVIHNHPSGNLSPSEADLSLSSIFGHHGHGVYIIDNEASRVYCVVEPFLQRDLKTLDSERLARGLGPDGKLARILPGYEHRPQQTAMLSRIARAFNHDGITAIEAPTGVGKTMAYLLPAAAWALENKERVVISTRTINLQEQIVEKDMPALQKALPKPCTACLVKGRRNYLCWRKLEKARSEAFLFEEENNAAIIRKIGEWAETTEDGSLSDLPFMPPREAWDEVASESDTCSPGSCPNPDKCFVGRARREMAKADLLVVNHHMLFSDVAIKREMGQFATVAVLPSYKRVILDEAHNIEDAATEYFGMEVTRNGAISLIGRFIRTDRGRERGLLPFLKLRFYQDGGYLDPTDVDPILDLIDEKLEPALTAAREKIEAAFVALREWVSTSSNKVGGVIQFRLTEKVLDDERPIAIHKGHFLPASDAATRCATLATQLLIMVKELPVHPETGETPWQTETLQLRAYTNRIKNIASGLTEALSPTIAENTVRWIEIDTRNKNIVRAARSPLSIGEPLADGFYANLATVAMTSATLSVGSSFDFFQERLGLNLIENRPVESEQLESPFNFQEQALLAVPTDLPSPEKPDFVDACADHCLRILEITKGHAFVLFTSFFALDRTHQILQPKLDAMGIRALKQGTASRSALLDQFRADSSSVLFATDSFWEGVDVAGDALQCVILPRLPFRVPTEPIQEARVEAIERAGKNAFMEYTVPQAVIRFRQGFGRLIRRRSDRGAVVVLDNRIVTRRYGRVFLDSLPGVPVVCGDSDAVYSDLESFFAQKDSKT